MLQLSVVSSWEINESRVQKKIMEFSGQMTPGQEGYGEKYKHSWKNDSYLC